MASVRVTVKVRITADYNTAKITQNCLVVVDGEDESKTESIEQYAVTRSNFSMCLQMIN